MKIINKIILVLFLSAGISGSTFAFPPKPETVPRMSVRVLEKATYEELAKQWREYIDQNGESAEALVNLATAYRYTHDKTAARKAAERAYELDPDEPEVLDCLGSLLCSYDTELERAIQLFKGCLEIAPDHSSALHGLAGIYLKLGDFEKVEATHKDIFDKRVIPRPLQDYAYNMLVGLPEGAVLITNGDNDTFPPIALQAGINFRTDVIVLNRSVFQTRAYAEAMFKRYPHIRPRGKIEPEGDLSLSSTLIKRMVSEAKAPIYFAATVYFDGLGFSPPLELEGLNYRSTGKGIPFDESVRTILNKYRLDSATDWTYAWELTPNVKRMMRNYIWCTIMHAEQDGVERDSKVQLLETGLAIAEFHEQGDLAARIEAELKK